MTKEIATMEKTTSTAKSKSGLHNLPEQSTGQKGSEKTVYMNGSMIRMTLSETGWINHIDR